MSFFQNFDEDRESVFHYDNGFDDSLYIVNLNNSSLFDQSNIFGSKEQENFNNFNLVKEAKNETNISNNNNFSTPSYFEESLSKNKNEEINAQIYEESTTKTINEINQKNGDIKNESTSKISDLSNRNSTCENLINSNNLIIKFKIKKDKNDDILTYDNSSLMNSLSEKAIRYYLEKGKGQNINYFFRNYIKGLDTQKKKLLQMILSSNEFISKIKKYKNKEKATSLSNKDETFLNKKRNLIINDKIKLNNIQIKRKDKVNDSKDYQFKIPFMLMNQSYKNKDLSMSFSFNRNIKNDICFNNKENKIKIVNNKIIDENRNNRYFNSDLNSKEIIDYESIFYNQFINKCPFKK